MLGCECHNGRLIAFTSRCDISSAAVEYISSSNETAAFTVPTVARANAAPR